MDVFFRRQIVVNEKLFKNFIGKLVEDGEDIEIFRTERANDLTTQQRQDNLFRMLQEATVDSIGHVWEVMEKIGEAKRAKEMALSMPRRQASRKAIIREPNPHLSVM